MLVNVVCYGINAEAGDVSSRYLYSRLIIGSDIYIYIYIYILYIYIYTCIYQGSGIRNLLFPANNFVTRKYKFTER